MINIRLCQVFELEPCDKHREIACSGSMDCLQALKPCQSLLPCLDVRQDEILMEGKLRLVMPCPLLFGHGSDCKSLLRRSLLRGASRHAAALGAIHAPADSPLLEPLLLLILDGFVFVYLMLVSFDILAIGLDD